MTPDPAAAQRGLRHVVRQASWGLSATLVGLGVRYALILVIARHYGADILGVYSLSVAIALLASIAATLGIDSSRT